MPRERYPGYRVLDQRGHWDDATRRVVLDRVYNVPSYQHFDAHQQATLEALCERVLPQRHRPPERRIPIGPWIDQRYAKHTPEGYRFEDMPPTVEAWDRGLAGLDETARALQGARFVDLDGPLLLARDREPGLVYEGSLVYPPSPSLWG